MLHKPTLIHTGRRQEALRLAELLEERGLESELREAPAGAAEGAGEADGPVGVLVSEADAEPARRLAAQWLRHLDGAPDRQPPDSPEEVWADWPRCPVCRRRRQTVCPVCETAGDAFPLAEYLAPAAPMESAAEAQEASEQEEECEREILLMCCSCDEAFTPRFYRLCPDCGHDFGEGLAPPRPGPAEMNRRVVFVLIGLAVLSAALFAYFLLLLQR